MFLKKIIFILILLFISVPIRCFSLCESSYSCLLMDVDSGRVLYSKRANAKHLIASTTKLMTFLVAYENGNLDDLYEAKEDILKMYGTSIYLSLGEKMSLKDLLYGLILRSGNDASVVIANNVFKDYDTFIVKMNERAQELGMKNTIFKNPHGLDEETENYSTSQDMALLSKFLYNIPFFRVVTSTKHYQTATDLKSYDWYNRNKLLTQYRYATGGKNGYTPKAGKTLVTTASKNNLSLTAVSLDDDNLYDTHISLYEYGFANYESYQIINKNTFSYRDSHYDGKMYVNNSFSYPITSGEKEKLEVVIQVIKKVDLEKSKKVGDVIVYFDGDEVYREDLLIKNNGVNNDSFLKRIKNFFHNFFKRLSHW